MDRFTYKDKNGNYQLDDEYVEQLGIDINGLADITDYIGEKEDLEEQLGCPLEVMVKALKQDYIFTKSGKHSRLEFGAYGFEWCICYELRTQIRVADYKKTWWLKKDKSE